MPEEFSKLGTFQYFLNPSNVAGGWIVFRQLIFLFSRPILLGFPGSTKLGGVYVTSIDKAH